MAHYKKRPKVKRYRRSFYSKGMRLKKGLGIAALLLAVLLAAWAAAPYLLDWATHTWYTVVRNRDLSDTVPTVSAPAENTDDAVSSTVQNEPEDLPEPEPEADTAILAGSWAEVDAAHLTDEASIRVAAQQLAARGTVYGLVCLKDSTGRIFYPSGVAAAANSGAEIQPDPAQIAAIFKEYGITPVAQLSAFRDPIAARTDRSMAVHYAGQEYLWLDNKAEAGGKPWLDPSSETAVQFIAALIGEVQEMGFDHVVLRDVQYPPTVSAKQAFGSAAAREVQLAADIAAWQAEFDTEVTLWYNYSLAQVTDAAPALGAPAAQLGMKNLLVEVPEASTLDEAERTALMQQLADAGVEHTVLRDEAADWFE